MHKSSHELTQTPEPRISGRRVGAALLAAAALSAGGAAKANAAPTDCLKVSPDNPKVYHASQAAQKTAARLQDRIRHRKPVSFDAATDVYSQRDKHPKHPLQCETKRPLVAKVNGKEQYFDVSRTGKKLSSLVVRPILHRMGNIPDNLAITHPNPEYPEGQEHEALTKRGVIELNKCHQPIVEDVAFADLDSPHTVAYNAHNVVIGSPQEVNLDGLIL